MKNRTGWSPEEEDAIDTGADAHAMGDSSEGNESASYTQNGNQDSTVEIIQGLITSGREYAQVETERQKLRIGIITATMRYSAMLGGIALFLLLGVLVSLPIGAIWILSQHVGPLAATLIVFLSGIALIILLLMLVRAKVRKAMRAVIKKSVSEDIEQ